MKTKKQLVLTMALMMALSLGACGEKPASKTTETAPVTTEASEPTTTEATEPTTTEAAQEDTDEMTYTLDYETIASWVDGGFIGKDDTGAPVVMAIDEANETAIIIFGDNTDMTAASFLGSITYDDTSGTIVDETNGTSLTFGVVNVSEDTLELDMGDIGKATITAASKEDVLEAIKNAIDNYKHIA